MQNKLRFICLTYHSDLGKPCPESGARFCIPCKSLNRISGTILPPLQKSKPDSEHDFLRSVSYALISGKVLPPLQKPKRNLRHTFATPATFCPRFLAHNSIFHLPSDRFWGNYFAFLLFCRMAVLTDGN